MTEEVAKRAKELYDQKANLSNSISKLINSTIYGVAYTPKRDVGDYTICSYGPEYVKLDFIEDRLKDFVLSELYSELQKVELEIKELKEF